MTDLHEDLGALVAQRRAELKISLRTAAEQSGVPLATLGRVEQGRLPDLLTFQKLIGWLGVASDRFFAPTERTETTPEVIADHLRTDPSLPPEAADRIAGIVRDLYMSLATPVAAMTCHLRAAKTFTPAALRLFTAILEDIQTRIDSEESE